MRMSLLVLGCTLIADVALGEEPLKPLTASSCEQDMSCERPQVEATQIRDVGASSVLAPKKKYRPENVLDDDEATAWCEGKKDDGLEERLTIRLKTEQTIDGLLITPFFGKSIALAKKNNQIDHIVVDVGTTAWLVKTTELTHNVCAPKDCTELNTRQQIRFPKPVTTRGVTLTIRSVKRGKKYRDTCISTVRLLQPDDR